jgi:hypothetical protein
MKQERPVETVEEIQAADCSDHTHAAGRDPFSTTDESAVGSPQKAAALPQSEASPMSFF